MTNQTIKRNLRAGRKVYCSQTKRIELGLKDQLMVFDLTTGRARLLRESDRPTISVA